ncbi:MAG: hypothetical protein U0790_06925 [Isosphaeraceae bacterium]
MRVCTARSTSTWSLQRSVRSRTSRIRRRISAQGSSPPWPSTTWIQPRTARRCRRRYARILARCCRS